jgi:hypothetical protein
MGAECILCHGVPGIGEHAASDETLSGSSWSPSAGDGHDEPLASTGMSSRRDVDQGFPCASSPEPASSLSVAERGASGFRAWNRAISEPHASRRARPRSSSVPASGKPATAYARRRHRTPRTCTSAEPSADAAHTPCPRQR